MAYIQQFLGEQLPGYLERVVARRCSDPDFLDYSKTGNFFEMVVDLVQLGREQGESWAQRTEELLRSHLLIGYQELREVNLQPREGESAIAATMKTAFGYVHNLMVQLMVRLLLLYLPTVHSQVLPPSAPSVLRELTYIYPALKTEVSFSHPHISLPDWLEKLLILLSKHKNFGVGFSQVLEQVRDDCCFIGPIEHRIEKFILRPRCDRPSTPHSIEAPLPRKPSGSSLIIAEKSERSLSREQRTFNDLQTFRRKKKIIFKEKTKTEQLQTPVKEKEFMRNSPKTEKTEDFRTMFDRDSSKQSSPLFRRMTAKARRPMDRTLYFGEKKRFLARAPNPELFLDPLPLSSSTITTDLPSFEPPRKTEKKRRLEPEEEDFSAGYCVPETPKPSGMNSLRGPKQGCSLEGGFSLEKRGCRI